MKNDGGPAFPNHTPVNDGERMHYGLPGMSLRDYFAAKALQGMTASRFNYADRYDFKKLAEIAYQLADAMLACRAVAPPTARDEGGSVARESAPIENRNSKIENP